MSHTKPVNPDRAKYIEKHGRTQYRRRYNAGWAYSERDGGERGLDPADSDGRSGDDAWMDGYLDSATERDKWHLLYCQDHDSCS